LLFSPARHHTTPLSFPTRRSSDLQVIALAGGMVLVTELITDVSHSWLAVAVLALLTPLPFLFGFAEPPAPARRPRTHQGRLRLRIPDLTGYHDYFWALISRVLINA